MTAPSEELLCSLETVPWRPRSLAVPPVMPERWRFLMLALIVAAHVVAIGWLLPLLMRSRQPVPEETVLVLEFPEARPEEMPAPVAQEAPLVKPEIRKRRRKPVRPADLPKPVELPRRESSNAPSPLQALPKTSGELQLYQPDGTLRVPSDMLEQIDKKFGDSRTFSYQVPHLEDAKKYFYRNPALVYEKTRFDEYWTPDRDALTDVLTRLVEKTTQEIRIPVPGRPGSTLICRISVLALGGGCGVLTNGADYVGPVDDPKTLSPEEDRQCAAWWEQIVGANSQEAWRKTRALYEDQCRKPTARQP